MHPTMSFHLGKPILVMLIVAAISGSAVLFRGASPRADLTVWTFGDSHYRCYKTLVPDFEKRTGESVQLKLVQFRSLNIRLESAFMGGSSYEQLPDLVEVEIGAVGRFFRPPLKDVPFLDLTERLKSSGWYDRVVQSRFAPWSKEGHIFGVPHDVHPVVLIYRDDLYRQAGIDLSQPKTWPELQQACLRFQEYWRQHGFPNRHAIELQAHTPESLLMMLLQRGINPVDDFNRLHLTDDKVAQTLAFYAQLVAGDGNIASESNGLGPFTKDLNEGSICAYLAADWRIADIRFYAGPGVWGKMRARPLPVFDPTDAPTATWGGTMMAIPRTCPNPDKAWELLEYLYFSRAGIEARRQESNILPPVRSFWNDPFYHEPDPFFGGQKANELLVAMAERIPPRYVTPATTLASANLTYALNQAVDYVQSYGTADLEAKCKHWLRQASDDLQKRMNQWRFDDQPEGP